MFKTPILLLVFNRPTHTVEMFAAIRREKPEKQYIACDGPREDKSDDIEKISLVKTVLSAVDWPCNVKTLFRDKNWVVGWRSGKQLIGFLSQRTPELSWKTTVSAHQIGFALLKNS